MTDRKPSPKHLQELYSKGVNISEYLRELNGVEENTSEILELAYDLQAGSYTAAMGSEEYAGTKTAYSHALADIILSLCKPTSILEAGVGEATTLRTILQRIGSPIESYGFDLSWSRLAYAKTWLTAGGITDTVLCTGDLLRIPFSDNSIDVVYTSHSIEPNGGSELLILGELYRVARKYLVMVEPGYEFAHESARKRMGSHGYCRDLVEHAQTLGFKILEHAAFPVFLNSENPVAVTIIKKGVQCKRPENVLACPIFKLPLKEESGALYSPEALSVYPIVGGIPCLRDTNAILASKYLDWASGNVQIPYRK